jgi:hypothetical protein
MPHHPHKKRRGRRRTFEGPQNSPPRLRYRTQFIIDDVITAIKMTAYEGPSESRQVILQDDSYPGREGTRYKFLIEYKKPGRYSTNQRNWITVNQIYGAVISDPNSTRIEFSPSFSDWERSVPLIILGVAALAFLIWVVAAEPDVPCFNCVMFFWPVAIGLCVASVAHREQYPFHDQNLKAVLKTLKAVKIEDEKPKNEASSKTKHADL